MLAYSSISQMGLIATILGMGLAAGDAGASVSTAFYAAHHVLAKGALFLAIGAAATAGTRGRMLVLGPTLILALGLGGLPLTGGALAKLAVKPLLGKGLVGMLGNLSAAGTTLLMLHFVRRLRAEPDSRTLAAEVSMVGQRLSGGGYSIGVGAVGSLSFGIGYAARVHPYPRRALGIALARAARGAVGCFVVRVAKS